MTVINKVATTLKRRDEGPNIELADDIASKNDILAVKELVENLKNKSKDIQHDCIKVLYEIGERKPELILEYLKVFVDLLGHKNNRLQWGAMTALNAIAKNFPIEIYSVLPDIISGADSGSVITRDYAVKILIRLAKEKQYSNDAFSLLKEQLMKSPTNQLPMYAEMAIPIINDKNKKDFVEILSSRLDDIEKDSKKKRVEKLIKKFQK